MKHIAIIMDGNRRRAKDQGLPGHKGHKAGAENIEKVVEAASEKGIEQITLWGLSTENLEKRSAAEVSEIVKLIVGAKKYLSGIEKNNGKIELIGDIDKLPKIARGALEYLVDKTKDNTGIRVVLALVYGGKNEIIRGIKKFITEGGNIDSLNELTFQDYLDTAKYPPADLIVRTGGDIRHSGFLLYQSDYSEYYFTKVKWPDFGKQELSKALDKFEESKRNFGK